MEVMEPAAPYLAKPLSQHTELGFLPIDWAVKQLADLEPFVTSGSRGWARFYAEAGAPFVRITNLSRACIYPDLTDLRYVRLPSNDSEGARTQLALGDVLISITADIGIVAFVSERVPTPAYVNQHIALVRFNPKRACARFVSYFLASEEAQKRFRSLTDAGAKAGMNLATVQAVLVALPPSVSEQEAIADALSDADALIESLEQLLAKKRQIKQGAMQELLTGQRRLAGFSEGWTETTLIELAAGRKELFDDGDWIESEHITTGGVRLVQTGNIGVGAFLDKDEKKYIYESSFVSLRCKEICAGDLLICRLADPAGRACVLPDIGEDKIVTSVDVTIFRPPEEVANRIFLAYLFSTKEWFQAVSDRSGGTTHKRIARGALGRMSIVVPKIEEQNAIATLLSSMDDELTALEARIAKARALKQGMAQALLTGRIRLV